MWLRLSIIPILKISRCKKRKQCKWIQLTEVDWFLILQTRIIFFQKAFFVDYVTLVQWGYHSKRVLIIKKNVKLKVQPLLYGRTSPKFYCGNYLEFCLFQLQNKKNKQSKTEIKQNSKTKNWTQSLCPRTQDRSHGACSYSVCNEVNPANAWSSTCEILLSFNNLKK